MPIVTLRPTSVSGVVGTWATSPASPSTLWDKVDEEVSDGDSTYIESSGTGVDACDFRTGGLGTDEPLSVTVKAEMRTVNGSASSALLTINGLATSVAITGSYSVVSATRALTSMQNFRFGLWANQAGVGVRVTQIWAEVTVADKVARVGEGMQSGGAAVGLGEVYDAATDTGHAEETIALNAALGVMDAGALVEHLSAAVDVTPIADSATAADAVSALAAALVSESSAGTDAGTVASTLTVAELVALADLVQASVQAGVADTGSFADVIMGLLVINVYVRLNGTVEPLGVIALRDGRADLVPSIRDHAAEIPGRNGEVWFGSDLGPRGVELRVMSKGGLSLAEKSALKRLVASRLSPTSGVFSIAWEEDPERYLEVRVAGAVTPEEYADCLEFTIPLKASQPFYLGSNVRSHTGAGEATCNGNMDTPATVTITGPVTNPSVTVGATAFTWTGTVGSADQLVIDGTRLTVTFNGVNALSGFAGSFPVLRPGSNTISVQSDGTVTVTWRDRWL